MENIRNTQLIMPTFKKFIQIVFFCIGFSQVKKSWDQTISDDLLCTHVSHICISYLKLTKKWENSAQNIQIDLFAYCLVFWLILFVKNVLNSKPNRLSIICYLVLRYFWISKATKSTSAELFYSFIAGAWCKVIHNSCPSYTYLFKKLLHF